MCLQASVLLLAQPSVSDSLEVGALQKGDSLTLQVTVYRIETQLAFLMQGVSIAILQPDTLTMSFPSADMVRDKVRRHPNEVKAVLEKQRKQQLGRDKDNHVVRPDVQPLVAALNDTTAFIYYNNSKVATRGYKIEVNRKDAIMVFSFKLHKNCITTNDGLICISIFSAPSSMSDRAEFSGERLSNDISPLPNGLGEGLRKEDVPKRIFKKRVIVKIYEE